VLEKSSPSSLKTLTSCGSTTGSPSLPPPGTATTKLQVAALTSVATVLEPSSRLSPTVLAQMPADPHRVAIATVRSSLTAPPAAAAATLAATAATTEAPTTGPTGGSAAGAVVAVETTRTQPRLRSLTGRLRRPPEDRRAAAEEVRHCRRQRRLPRLLTSTSQLAPPRQVQAFGDHQV
jgi:hypothetical protein